MAIPFVFVAGTVIEPEQVNDNFTYVADLADGALDRNGTNVMLAPLPLANGTESLPGLTWASDPDTGIYRSASNTMVLVAAGNAIATINAAGMTVATPWPVASGGTGAATAADAAEALGVGATDSPQFAAINLSHATANTLTASSGDLSIEGNVVYRAGGTDVPVADGGTGASSAAAGLANLGGASITQTGEMFPGLIAGTMTNRAWTWVLKAAHGGTITETTTKSASGTATLTFSINATPLGGTANAVSSSEVSQAHASANTFAAGDDIIVTFSSVSSCVDVAINIKYTRVYS